MLLTEIAVLKKIQHPNLVKLHEVINDPKHNKLYLVIDYMNLGSIGSPAFKKYIGDPDSDTIPIDKLWIYFRGCLKGLDYCKQVILKFSAQCGKSYPL